jgi:hypothetical protein
MATEIDRFNPTFSLFPINNNRTGYKPFWIPTVLAVPFKRSVSGDNLADSNVFDVQYFIENAPGRARVAGFENQGIFVPKLERFVVDVSTAELEGYKVDLVGQVFESAETGAQITYDEAKNGDFFYLTLMRGDARDKITFYKDSDYYDLSPVSIDTIELKPLGVYNFVWQASYKERIQTPDDELLCIGENDKFTRLALATNHPGDVHRGMVENTPSVYFEGNSLDNDGTVDFYRPFADVLQDIFDEQSFIRGINWVNKIPAQYVPYLSYLIGWDLPYFSTIDDNIRLSFVRNARSLQQLKGSKRAVWELFEIFGFTIDIVNLWTRSDGKAFIGPDDPIERGYENEFVTEQEVCTTEPMISDNQDSGFGDVQIPLLFRPTGNFTIESWLVEDGTSRDELLAIVNKSVTDPESLDHDSCSSTPDGMLISPELDTVSPATMVGFSKVLVDYEAGKGADEITSGLQPVNQEGVTYNKDTNIVTIVYDRYLDLTNQKLFVFAIYEKDKITPSPVLEDLRSNRFDIRILLFKDGEQPDSDIYDFLLDYLFKIKAFHSLLRKIIFDVEVVDVYNVIDFCMGGENKQAPGTDAGELQVPPAIKPIDPTCSSDYKDRGFKDNDLALREKIIGGLEEEQDAWKNLDGKYDIPASIRPIIESLSRVPIPQPQEAPCEYTYRGQDRVLADPDLDTDQNPDTREKLCSLDDNIKDYCYKGRARDELIANTSVKLDEYVKCKPCILEMGDGAYWTGSLIDPLNQWKDKNNYNNSWSDRQFVRRAAYNDPIHFTNRSLLDLDSEADAMLAIRRPSLNIQKDNMFFPGHRFPNLYALEDDYLSPDYDFRPWDDLLNLPCPEDRPLDSNGNPLPIPDLHAKLETDTEGNEWLVFDKVQLVYYGNGLVPDISSFGEHVVETGAGFGEGDVTHQIYSSQELPSGTEDVIDFDTITFTDSTSICAEDPIFKSANRDCLCGTGVAEDYIDGYPSVSGRYEYDSSTGFIGDDMDRIVWAELLNLPDSGTDVPELLFKAGSGVRSTEAPWEPYRTDCGCLFFQCGSGEEATVSENLVTRCNLHYFQDQFGDLDFDCDKVDIFQTMVLPEEINTCSYRFNGEIPNFFVLDSTKVRFDTSGPVPIGSFKFQDEWGTIQSAEFRTVGDKLDVAWISMNPRVWGEEVSGYTDGLRVFREGIITVQRQILQTVDGEYRILSESAEQFVSFFQNNIICGGEAFLDPFIFHLECAVTDEVKFEVLIGPKWGDAEGDGSFWPTFSQDSDGNVYIDELGTGSNIFTWIDAWVD